MTFPLFSVVKLTNFTFGRDPPTPLADPPSARWFLVSPSWNPVVSRGFLLLIALSVALAPFRLYGTLSHAWRFRGDYLQVFHRPSTYCGFPPAPPYLLSVVSFGHLAHTLLRLSSKLQPSRGTYFLPPPTWGGIGIMEVTAASSSRTRSHSDGPGSESPTTLEPPSKFTRASAPPEDEQEHPTLPLRRLTDITGWIAHTLNLETTKKLR